MAEIAPFKGIRYDTGQSGLLETVVAPPYDVISPEQQGALYDTSPNNIVRVILNRDADPYLSAAQVLRQWLASGILVQDAEESLYEYCQEFSHPANGQRYSRKGVFCALKLEPYSAGVVLPHEETRSKAKEDRLRLIRSTRCNPEPIFGLYEDNEHLIERALASATSSSPDDFCAMVDGDIHRIRRISDPQAIAAMQKLLANKTIWIADGHHRYETALAYRDERREGDGDPTAPYESILIVLSAFNDPGLVVLPTHRLIRSISQGRLDQLTLQLERYFEVEPVSEGHLPAAMSAGTKQFRHRFGMVSPDGFWCLKLRDEAVMDAADEAHSSSWKRLDVSILHTLILDRSLGIPPETLATTTDVAYTRDRAEAVQRARTGEFQLAFLLNDPTADEVRRVASEGDKMPAKSTFFYPKLWSGLLMRDLQ